MVEDFEEEDVSFTTAADAVPEPTARVVRGPLDNAFQRALLERDATPAPAARAVHGPLNNAFQAALLGPLMDSGGDEAASAARPTTAPVRTRS